jgi:methylated-DNA-[protein]-cysteine S-methyltransferase
MKHQSSFASRCYALLKQVPAGKVTTYKYVAQALGSKAYRAVGRAMHDNPDAPHTPCHRVVASNGHLHGYAYGLDQKKTLLEQEGVLINNHRVANFETYLYRFEKETL